MRTKWQILEARLAEARAKVAELERELAGLEATPFSRGCSVCGVALPTEAAFARHFVIPDERYLNLGECPEDRRVTLIVE